MDEKNCTCKLCNRNKRITQIVSQLETEEREFIKEVLSDLFMVEFERNCWRVRYLKLAKRHNDKAYLDDPEEI